jgi:hypothetical protein
MANRFETKRLPSTPQAVAPDDRTFAFSLDLKLAERLTSSLGPVKPRQQ